MSRQRRGEMLRIAIEALAQIEGDRIANGSFP